MILWFKKTFLFFCRITENLFFLFFFFLPQFSLHIFSFTIIVIFHTKRYLGNCQSVALPHWFSSQCGPDLTEYCTSFHGAALQHTRLRTERLASLIKHQLSRLLNLGGLVSIFFFLLTFVCFHVKRYVSN